MQLAKHTLNYKCFMLLMCIFVLSGCLTTPLEEFEAAVTAEADAPSPSNTYLATETVTTPTTVGVVQTEVSATTTNEGTVTKDSGDSPRLQDLEDQVVMLQKGAKIFSWQPASQELDVVLAINDEVLDYDISLSPHIPWLTMWEESEEDGTFNISLITSQDAGPVATLTALEPYDSVNVSWLFNSVYVRLSFAEKEEIGGYIQSKALIMVVETGEVITPREWNSDCRYLAVSPTTNHLSLWCETIDVNYESSPPYYVLESDGSYWLSDKPPENVVKEKSYSGTHWVWSNDAQYVAVTQINPDFTERLEILDPAGNKLIEVQDETSSYSGLQWASDNAYLAFIGNCELKFCNKIVDTRSGDIVWTSANETEFFSSIYAWLSNAGQFSFLSEGKLFVLSILSSEMVEFPLEMRGVKALYWPP